jgi:hypothetical protein
MLTEGLPTFESNQGSNSVVRVKTMGYTQTSNLSPGPSKYDIDLAPRSGRAQLNVEMHRQFIQRM